MKSKRIFSSIPGSLFILMTLGGVVALAETQPVASSSDGVIKPTSQVSIPPAQVRTWEQMQAQAALQAPEVAPSFQSIPFLPTMDDAAYKASKDKAAQDSALQAPTTSENKSVAPLAQTQFTETINFDGVDSVIAGNFTPPDTHGAVGLNHFVEITNSHLDVYEKAAPNTRIGSLPLIYFFRYPTSDFTPTYFYDPRVIYDQNENRWIMSALARLNPPTWSKDSSLRFPKLPIPWGLIISTRSLLIFSAGSGISPRWGWIGMRSFSPQISIIDRLFMDARMFAVAKSLVYNGCGPDLDSPYVHRTGGHPVSAPGAG